MEREKLISRGEMGLNGVNSYLMESFKKWYRTGKPRARQSMGSQRVTHDLAPEQQRVFLRIK